MTHPIICIMGPTASGKTDLAVQLVAQLPLAIISVDSALIYREMDIGTAKPTQQTLESAPHYLLNLLDPSQRYSAADFCTDAKIAMEEIQQQQKIPLLVGGTMMYFKALQQGLAHLPSASIQLREKLAAVDIQSLYQTLTTLDPITANRIKPQDSQRIQRALEVYYLTGKPLSQHLKDSTQDTTAYDYINIGLMPGDRQKLHEHIAARFKQMLQQGLVEEVANLRSRGDLTVNHPSMRTVGYRQVWQYLAGEFDYPTMIEKAIAATRQLAKRQMTWLRSWPDITLFDPWDEELVEKVMKTLTLTLSRKRERE